MNLSTFVTVVCFLCLLKMHKASKELEKKDLSDEKQKEKRVISKALGLGNSPRTDPNRKDFLAKKYSAPKFMINLFNELEGVRVGGPKHSQSGDECVAERKFIEEANVDTVISFFKYVRDDNWSNSRDDIKLKFCPKLHSDTDHVRRGEFKVFKRLPRTSTMANSTCRISVYVIVRAEIGEVLLDSRDVHAWHSGWHTFNVTIAVKQWAWFPVTNHGLKLVVHNISSGEIVDPHAFGIVNTRGNREKRPYLIGLLNTDRKTLPTFTQELASSRERRAAQENKHWSKITKRCHLKQFYVNFKKIGLDNKIIAPKGYHAHFCRGTCSYPLDKNTNLTNHSIIQAMVNLVDPTGVPTPCCAPATLQPMSVLFFDDDNNVVLKRHPDMVVTSCACQ